MLKYIITLTVLISTNLFSQIKFENSLQKTFEKAKLENKAVFIEYYNESCSVCKQVNPLLESKDVSNIYNNLFISYKINTYNEVSDYDKNFLDKHRLFFKDVPNFIYFDKNQNFLHFTSGKADVNYIIQTAQDALNPLKQAATLKDRIKNGDNGVTTLYEYSFLAQLNNNQNLVNNIANDIFTAFNKSKLGNKTSYLILKNAVFTTQNGFFEYWIKNLDKIINLDSGQLKGKEIEVLKNIISLDLADTKIKWNHETLNNLCDYIILSNYSQKPEILLVDKRLELFDKKNISKETENYFNHLLNNQAYSIEDKIYILESLKTSESKKTIKKFALVLTNQTKKEEELKSLYDLTK